MTGEAPFNPLKPTIMTWYSFSRISRPDPDKVVAELQLDKDSPWFSGHFPGNPILPGIAQLEMALDAIRAFEQRDCRVSEVKKVRFKKMIRPDDTLTIIVKRRDQNPIAYSFRIMVEGQSACTGLLIRDES